MVNRDTHPILQLAILTFRGNFDNTTRKASLTASAYPSFPYGMQNSPDGAAKFQCAIFSSGYSSVDALNSQDGKRAE